MDGQGHGAFIESGATDWQVFQRGRDGTGEIRLRGQTLAPISYVFGRKFTFAPSSPITSQVTELMVNTGPAALVVKMGASDNNPSIMRADKSHEAGAFTSFNRFIDDLLNGFSIFTPRGI